ncbi:MAG: hypothetical protein Fur0046_08050 [Cyanobacteria bacterium J069]|nr:MAG: hypothetical protein D6742_10870 [Cyanobacteria bacterium J069]
MQILGVIQHKQPEFYEVLQLMMRSLALDAIAPNQATYKAFSHYAGMLFLLLQHPRLIAVPTLEIDEVLHHFLHQQDRKLACFKGFNFSAIAHIKASNNQTKFAQTKALFEQEFQTTYGDQSAACEIFIRCDVRSCLTSFLD